MLDGGLSLFYMEYLLLLEQDFDSDCGIPGKIQCSWEGNKFLRLKAKPDYTG